MVYRSKIFRVFVSSTFSDMVNERNALQEHVFPKLRKLCASKGFQFQALDLRWGVSQEAGLNQRAVSICMREIERCQQATKRPNFLLLMGDRYGWQPLPETIPAIEFEVIEKSITTDKRSLLDRWYWRDDNAVPSEYILQPRRGKYEDYEVWIQIETELRTAIRNAISGTGWSEQQLIKYTTSVTEQEIIEGIFNHPSAHESAYCFFRNIQTVSDNLYTSAFIELNNEAKHKLQTLKNRLYQHIPDNIHEYSVSISNKGISTDHIQQLCEDVEARLTEAILAEIEIFEETGPKTLDQEAHHSFMLERTQHFVGRVDVLEKISRYISSESNAPLVLHGESGIGKSSVMAQAIHQTEAHHLIYRFIGVTPASSNIVSLFISVCEEIVERYDSDVYIPPLYDDLLDVLPDVFALATEEQPIVLFLDALDQLTAIQSPENLRWLAQIRSQHVKIIISVTPGVYLDALQRGQGIEFNELKPLSQYSAASLLDLWLTDAGRKLRVQQRNEVLDKFSQCGLAIYLKLAFGEAHLWHSYTDRFELAPDVVALIRDNLFVRLSSPKEHGEMLVSRAMSYLAASRYGLTENEILELLALDDDYWNNFIKDAFHRPVGRQVPIVIWSRLEQDLRTYMIERVEYGITTYDFYHQQFTQAIHSIYLEQWRQVCHRNLANYFSKQELYVADEANVRKVSELPYQQAKAKLNVEYVNTLTDFPFIKAGLDVLGIQNLVAHFDLLHDDTILIIQSALENGAHVLSQDNDALAHQLRGRLGYYGSKSITNFINNIPLDKPLEPTQGWLNVAGKNLVRTLQGHINWVSGSLQLSDGNILSWSRDKTLRLWSADGNPIKTLSGHTHSIIDALQLRDGNILSWGNDQTLRLWSADGSPIETLSGHTDAVTGALQLQDENILSWADGYTHSDNTLRLWSADGSPIETLSGHTDAVTGALQLHDGNILSWAAGFRSFANGDKSLRLWSADGRPIRTLSGHTDAVIGAFQLQDGNILSWSRDRNLRKWQTIGAGSDKLTKHTDAVTGLLQLHDGNILSWANWIIDKNAKGDKDLRLWSADGSPIETLSGHTDAVTGALQLHDENILSWSGGEVRGRTEGDKYLRLWSAGGKPIKILSGHTDAVIGAFQLHDGNILSRSRDMTLRLWSADGKPIKILSGHTNAVTGALQLHDGNILSWATGITFPDGDKYLRLWSAGGKPIKILSGHTDAVIGAFQLHDGNILSWSRDSSLRIWKADGRSVRTLIDHTEAVTGALQLQDGNILSWCGPPLGFDRSLRLWHTDGTLIKIFEEHSGSIEDTLQLQDGRIMSWAVSPLRLWQPDGTAIKTINAHTSDIIGVMQIEDSNILSWSADNTLRLWDNNMSQIGLVYFDSPLTIGKMCENDSTLVFGDMNGQVIFIKYQRQHL